MNRTNEIRERLVNIKRMVEIFANNQLNDDNCASVDLASRRIKNYARPLVIAIDSMLETQNLDHVVTVDGDKSLRQILVETRRVAELLLNNQLNDDNCASVEVASRRLRGQARPLLAPLDNVLKVLDQTTDLIVSPG